MSAPLTVDQFKAMMPMFRQLAVEVASLPIDPMLTVAAGAMVAGPSVAPDLWPLVREQLEADVDLLNAFAAFKRALAPAAAAPPATAVVN